MTQVDDTSSPGFRAVQAASRLCLAVRAALTAGDAPAAFDKPDSSPVTVADFGSQALVCRELERAWPGVSILAEEDSAALRQPESAARLAAVVDAVRVQVQEADAGAVYEWIDLGRGSLGERYWVLDPIDGTKGFLRNDQYAVALALIERGEVSMAYLACPALSTEAGRGAILAAQAGRGVRAYTLDGRSLGPCHMRDLTDPSLARLAESVESAHTDHGLSANLKRDLRISPEPLRMDSQAKYAALALGQADVYLRAPNPRSPDYRENVWDHAAGWLVVTEAGGTVSDVYGRPLDWTLGPRLIGNVGILAAPAAIHGRLLEALRPHLPALA